MTTVNRTFSPRPRPRWMPVGGAACLTLLLAAGPVPAAAGALAADLGAASDCGQPAPMVNAGRLPLLFTPSRGLHGPETDFFAATLGSGTLTFGAEGRADLFLAAADASPAAHARLEWLDTRPGASPRGARPAATATHHLVGADPRGWRLDLPSYGSLAYRGLYPGVALRYDGDGRRLGATLELAAGADVSRLAWRLGATGSGAEAPARIADGEVLLPLGPEATAAAEAVRPARTLTLHRPTAWQQGQGGRRTPVAVSYRLRDDGAVTLALGAHDRSRPVSIAFRLLHSPYFDDFEVASDAEGNLLLAGATAAVRPDAAAPGRRDVFVARLDAKGERLLSRTFLGGEGDDRARGLALAASGEVYLAGETTSRDFTAAPDAGSRSRGGREGFAARLAADGRQVLGSLYLGGPGDDAAHDVVLTAAGSVVVTGAAGSPLPEIAAHRLEFDAFVPRGAGASRSYFVTELTSDLTAVAAQGGFTAAAGARIQAWRGCGSARLAVGVPWRSVAAPDPTAPRAAICASRDDGPLTAPALPQEPCSVIDTYSMSVYSGNYGDQWSASCWGHMALTWKKLRYNVTYNAGLYQPPCYSVGFGDEQSLNALEADFSVFPGGNPPGSWFYNDSFSAPELAVCAGIAMHRWQTPVFTELNFGGTAPVVIRRVSFEVFSPNSTMRQLCDWLGWSNNGTPIDQVDQSCANLYQNSGFVVSSVVTNDWNFGYHQNVNYNGSTFASKYPGIADCIADPPAAERHIARGIPEVARRLRKLAYVELDPAAVGQMAFRAGRLTAAARPATGRVLVRAVDLAPEP